MNKSLKSIIQRAIEQINTNCHIMLYPALWAYETAVKTSTCFSPYQLVHGAESVLLVECKIPSLNLAIDILPDSSILEECLVHLEQLDE